MELSDFNDYWWEWGHRQLGRDACFGFGFLVRFLLPPPDPCGLVGASLFLGGLRFGQVRSAGG